MSCHFILLLICHFRDRYFHLHAPLHLTWSDAYKKKFSKIGEMVGLECVYNFHELVGTTHTLNQLVAVEYGNKKLMFGRLHNKMENIWT
jgi:hypothetical protein